MTETLISKLEEKLMLILTELEKLRTEAFGLKQENTALRIEREKVEERLKSLMTLFDAVDTVETFSPIANTSMGSKPVLIQG